MSFAKTFKKRLQDSTRDDFDQLAMSLFRYQVKHNKVYGSFCKHLGVNPQKVKKVEQIPFIPIEFFKSHEVICDHNQGQKTIFESSGTTGNLTSRHLVYDKEFYLENALRHFEERVNEIKGTTVLALLPSYLERNNSSLIAMVDHFIKKSGKKESGFFLDNTEELHKTLMECKKKNTPTILFGVTFALLDFIRDHKLPSFDNLLVMDTGGMKGRKKEITREEVYDNLQQAGAKQVCSEYGMTELLSQAYSLSDGLFKMSDTLRVFVRDLRDPLDLNSQKRGALNIIDLANVDSCAFIATQDLGRLIGKSFFQVIGRCDNSDVRGCNLLI